MQSLSSSFHLTADFERGSGATSISLLLWIRERGRWTQPITVLLNRTQLTTVVRKLDRTRPDPIHEWTQPVSISAMYCVCLLASDKGTFYGAANSQPKVLQITAAFPRFRLSFYPRDAML